jgi:hypothetical protein
MQYVMVEKVTLGKDIRVSQADILLVSYVQL